MSRPRVGTASMFAQQHDLAVTEEWMKGWNACLDALDAAEEQPPDEIERLQKREYVMAQHDETGRYWSGPREGIPPRFAEVPERAEGGPARDQPAASKELSSADHNQRAGHLPSPKEWQEACRLFRQRCSAYDCEQMARLRTYIEEGLLVVVRPVCDDCGNPIEPPIAPGEPPRCACND